MPSTSDGAATLSDVTSLLNRNRAGVQNESHSLDGLVDAEAFCRLMEGVVSSSRHIRRDYLVPRATKSSPEQPTFVPAVDPRSLVRASENRAELIPDWHSKRSLSLDVTQISTPGLNADPCQKAAPYGKASTRDTASGCGRGQGEALPAIPSAATESHAGLPLAKRPKSCNDLP